jgi:hypothetical protein
MIYNMWWFSIDSPNIKEYCSHPIRSSLPLINERQGKFRWGSSPVSEVKSGSLLQPATLAAVAVTFPPPYEVRLAGPPPEGTSAVRMRAARE